MMPRYDLESLKSQRDVAKKEYFVALYAAPLTFCPKYKAKLDELRKKWFSAARGLNEGEEYFRKLMDKKSED